MHGCPLAPPLLPLLAQVINKSMAGIVKNLDSALKANNLEKVAQTMDQVGRGWGGLGSSKVCGGRVQRGVGGLGAFPSPTTNACPPAPSASPPHPPWSLSLSPAV